MKALGLEKVKLCSRKGRLFTGLSTGDERPEDL